MESAPNSPVDVARWVDTHCHLFLAKEPAEVLVSRAVAAGVDWVMVPGTDVAGSQQACIPMMRSAGLPNRGRLRHWHSKPTQ